MTCLDRLPFREPQIPAFTFLYRPATKPFYPLTDQRTQSLDFDLMSHTGSHALSLVYPRFGTECSVSIQSQELHGNLPLRAGVVWDFPHFHRPLLIG